MSVMNIQEQKLVEDHLYLVKNIVLATISINESIQGMGYDDLYQTGCEALCHAAKYYKKDRGASFPTFADTVIKNRLISHCRKIIRLQEPIRYLDAPLEKADEMTFADILPDTGYHTLSTFETLYLLEEMEKNYHGICKKGIESLKLKCMGHTGVEIARYFGVRPNHVAAWISRAVTRIRTDFSYSVHKFN